MPAVKARPVSRAETRRAIEEALDTLNRVPCQFWACPGPDKPTRAYFTCAVCYQMKRLRVLLARLAGDGGVR